MVCKVIPLPYDCSDKRDCGFRRSPIESEESSVDDDDLSWMTPSKSSLSPVNHKKRYSYGSFEQPASRSSLCQSQLWSVHHSIEKKEQDCRQKNSKKEKMKNSKYTASSSDNNRNDHPDW